MKRSSVINIVFISLFVVPFLLLPSCNTDDVNIDGTGISSDSIEIFVDSMGKRNTFIVSSLYPWTLAYEYEADRSWLTADPVEGNRTSTISLTAEANKKRRRTTFLALSNEYGRIVKVKVIQKAGPAYEPGTVLLSENFGLSEMTARTAVADYINWGKTGTGSSSVTYSGSAATVQSDVNSVLDATPAKTDVLKGMAYLDASGGNNVEIEAGGSFKISRIGVNNADRMILTLYVFSPSGDGYEADPSAMISIEGGTLDDAPMDGIEFSVVDMPEYHGWQKIEAEFRKVPGAGSFYIQFNNTGAETIYIDDILVESAGKGTEVIGTPVPNVTTLDADNVTAASATLKGSYTLPASITQSEVDSAGFFYKLNTAEEYIWHKVDGAVPEEEFEYALENVTDGEIYFYYAGVSVNGYLTYGVNKVVTIQDPAPEPGDGDE